MDKQVSVNPEKNRETTQKLTKELFIVSAILITLYLAANVMAVKILSINGTDLFDSGTVLFPFTLMLGDLIVEIWGFKTARTVIYVSFLCNALFVLCTALGGVLPCSESMRDVAEAYNRIFSYVPRIVIASLPAFLAGELSNGFVMEKIKALTGEKHLWLRSVGSSVIGHAADTAVFVILAFWGSVTAASLVSMFLIQYVTKLLIEVLLGTPLLYLGVKIIRR